MTRATLLLLVVLFCGCTLLPPASGPIDSKSPPTCETSATSLQAVQGYAVFAEYADEAPLRDRLSRANFTLRAVEVGVVGRDPFGSEFALRNSRYSVDYPVLARPVRGDAAREAEPDWNASEPRFRASLATFENATGWSNPAVGWTPLAVTGDYLGCAPTPQCQTSTTTLVALQGEAGYDETWEPNATRARLPAAGFSLRGPEFGVSGRDAQGHNFSFVKSGTPKQRYQVTFDVAPRAIQGDWHVVVAPDWRAVEPTFRDSLTAFENATEYRNVETTWQPIETVADFVPC